jgi:hypothetical protein
VAFENVYKLEINYSLIAFWRFFLGLSAIFLLSLTILGQTQLSQPDDNTIIVENAPEQDIFAFGKTVIVKQKVKGVLSFGGDVIIEGEVTGEVATIGGSIIQKKDAFIGGDVFVIGGKYEPELKTPRRNIGKETVIYAGYEEEIRSLSQNPSEIFSPTLTWSFVVQRLFSLLFWFGISFILILITPGAIGRAVARFQLSSLKILGIGAFAFVVITLGVMVGFGVLPSFASGILSLIAFIMLMLSYVFGRVALQASFGKWVLRKISNKQNQSETFALFLGALIWTLLLSIPYIWTLALFTLFTASLGLVLTSRSTKEKWQIS